MTRLHTFWILAALSLTVSTALADDAVERAVNGLRAEHGLSQLSENEALQLAATAHAEDMLRHRYFSHNGRDGSTVADRVNRAGYRWCYVAENIAQGQKDLHEVMRAWAQSPGHRANLLSSRVREFGLAAGSGYIWVLVLAARDC